MISTLYFLPYTYTVNHAILGCGPCTRLIKSHFDAITNRSVGSSLDDGWCHPRSIGVGRSLAHGWPPSSEGLLGKGDNPVFMIRTWRTPPQFSGAGPSKQYACGIFLIMANQIKTCTRRYTPTGTRILPGDGKQRVTAFHLFPFLSPTQQILFFLRHWCPCRRRLWSKASTPIGTGESPRTTFFRSYAAQGSCRTRDEPSARALQGDTFTEKLAEDRRHGDRSACSLPGNSRGACTRSSWKPLSERAFKNTIPGTVRGVSSILSSCALSLTQDRTQVLCSVWVCRHRVSHVVVPTRLQQFVVNLHYIESPRPPTIP